MKKKLIIVFTYLLVCFHVHAQLCNGSLGDPVVNVTFGSNATFNGPLKAGVTNMTYTNSGCPNDGEYTISNSSIGCFGNSWHSMITDHTGDPGGRFMLINASPLPSQFYVDTVSGLCANTTFEFAAWVVNVLRPSSCNGVGIKPNLTFSIENTNGSLIKKFDTGDIPFENQEVWKQYGTFFKTPVGVSKVVLRIVNNSPGGIQCGNDLALDDITFKPCGPTIIATLDNTVQPKLDICENNRSSFQFSTSFPLTYATPLIQWQVTLDTGKTWKDIPGEISLNFTRTPTTSGSFQYRAVMAEASNFNNLPCRIASNVTIINVNPLPDASGDKNLLGCFASDLRLQEVDGVAFTYIWSGPNGFTSNVKNPLINKVKYADSGNYIAIVKTDAGCNRTDTFHVTVYPGTTATVSAGTTICEGNSTLLSASGGIKYLWSPSNGLSDSSSASPLASPVDTTNYHVVVFNQYGCSDSANILINVFKKLIVNAGPDKVIFEGDTVTLNGSIIGIPSIIYWLPNTNIQNGNTPTPIVNPIDSTTYTLYASSSFGCPTVSDDAFVRVYKKLHIPNIFSPNGDGINDTWVIQNMETYPSATVKVFTRNGQAVFESKKSDAVWDGNYMGKPLPVATYYYIIDLNIGQPPVTGWVVIVR